MLPVTDALLIGVHVSAVVVVARLGQTTRDRIRRTTAALTHVNAHMAGVIPNGAIEREDSAYYYAYRYRSKRQPPDIPYRATDPVVVPDQNGLRPAVMANGKSHEPSSEPDETLVDSTAEPIGKHSPGYGRRATDTPAPPPQV